MSYRILALIKISMLFLSFGVLAYDPLVEETLQSPQIKHVMDFLKENGYQSKPEIFIETYNAEVKKRESLDDSNYQDKFSNSSITYGRGTFAFYNYQHKENYILVDPELNVTHMQLKLKTYNSIELFSALPSLAHLAIDVGEIDEATINLSENKNLKELYLNRGTLSDVILPKDSSVEMIGTFMGRFNRLTNLKYQEKLLLLSVNNDVVNIGEINNHSSLEMLRVISGGKLSFDLLTLQELKYLELYGGQEDDLSEIHKLNKLKVLSIGGGGYVGSMKIPSSLEYLSFGGSINNKSPKFPDVNNLKEIFIANASFDELVGFENLNSLLKLTIYETPLKKISGLDSLKKLKELRIERSNITKIENVEHLDNLEVLSLSYNKIKTIDNINGLKSIKHIQLDVNEIENIDFSVFDGIEGCRVYLLSNPVFDNSEGELYRKLMSLETYGDLTTLKK